jgi:hypothetical protein
MRCANPKCQAESNYLRDGSLYWIDELHGPAGPPQRRFIWLCSECCVDFSVETWRPPGQQLVLKSPAHSHHLQPIPPRKHTLPSPTPLLSEAKHRARA